MTAKKGTSNAKASVLECQKQGKKMIVKILHDRNDKKIQRELEIASILQKNHHRNLIAIHDIFLESQLAYIFMERCEMTLQEYIEKKQSTFTENEYLDFLEQISSGYNHLIGNKIFHRDLKAENIVVTINQGGPIYKLIDFGASKIERMNLPLRFQTPAQGTQATQAPEVKSTNYDNRADLYSLAIVLLQMCDFIILKQSYSNGKKLIDYVSKQPPFSKVFVKPDNLPQFVWDILDQIIRENRISWEEFGKIIISQKQKVFKINNFNSPIKQQNIQQIPQQFTPNNKPSQTIQTFTPTQEVKKQVNFNHLSNKFRTETPQEPQLIQQMNFEENLFRRPSLYISPSNFDHNRQFSQQNFKFVANFKK